MKEPRVTNDGEEDCAELLATEFEQGLIVPCTLILRMSQPDYRISEEKNEIALDFHVQKFKETEGP